MDTLTAQLEEVTTQNLDLQAQVEELENTQAALVDRIKEQQKAFSEAEWITQKDQVLEAFAASKLEWALIQVSLSTHYPLTIRCRRVWLRK